MLKVKLRYTNCLQDGKNVFRILAAHNVKILRTNSFLTTYPKITVLVKDHNELMDILYNLNNQCTYEVSIVKVKKVDKFPPYDMCLFCDNQAIGISHHYASTDSFEQEVQ